MFPIIIEVPISETENQTINLAHMTRIRKNPENDQTTIIYLAGTDHVIVNVSYDNMKAVLHSMQQALTAQRQTPSILVPQSGRF